MDIVEEHLRMYLENIIRYILKKAHWTYLFCHAGLYATELAGAETGRLLRRTIIRYITLSYCIALRCYLRTAHRSNTIVPCSLFRTVSWRLRRRFPSLDHLVHAGHMRADEREMFSKMDERTHANKWYTASLSVVLRAENSRQLQ